MNDDLDTSTAAVDTDMDSDGAPGPQLTILDRALIVASRTNPRTHFDPTYIKELGASIKAHKIIQPLLVRPLPASRLEETSHLAPRPTHEVVCGECRFRAAGEVDEQDIPVLIRHLDDLQVLQIQLIENLRRRDLHPLEEAEGFDRLMKDHGLAIADIAARIDKSESYIYKALKLLELTPECREQLYAGKLSQSTALLVARAPAHLQAKIAKEIMEDGFDDEPMSFRQASRYIHDNYMLRLADAVFDIKDASLVAKAGACGTCQKNTGANKDLFGDVSGGDNCTDSKCFDSKKVAHFAAVAKAAEAKGQTVIQGKEAKELWPEHHSHPKGYELLDSNQYINGKTTTLRKLMGKDSPPPVVIVDPRSKVAVEVIPTDVASKVIKKASAEGNGRGKPKDLTAHALEQDFENRWHRRSIEKLHGALMAGKGNGITVALARVIAKRYSENLYGDDATLFARLFDVPESKVATQAGIDEFLDKCADHQVGPALILLIAFEEFEYASGSDLKNLPALRLIVDDYGVDIKALQDDVKAEMKSEAAERAAAPATAAKVAGGTKKPAVKTASKRSSNHAFLAPLHCSPALQVIVGTTPIPRTEIVSALWAYIKKNKLQDTVNKRMVNCDEKLQALFGKQQVSMFEMAEMVGKQCGSKPFVTVTTAQNPAPVKTAAKKKAATAKEDAKLPLKNGALLDPQSAWPFPTASKRQSIGARK